MGFQHRNTFQRCSGFGTSTGPRHSVITAVADSGRVVRKGQWTANQTRLSIDLDLSGMARDTIADVLSQLHVARGPAFGFPVRDWADWSTHPNHDSAPNPADPTHWTFIGLGNGALDRFPVYKAYGTGTATLPNLTEDRFRRISKIIPPGEDDHLMAVSVYTTDVVAGQLTEGTHYSVDYDQGFVRFATPPAPNLLVGACFAFYTPARFSTETAGGMEITYSGPDEASVDNGRLNECSLQSPGEWHDEWDAGGWRDVTVTQGSPHQIKFEDGLFQEFSGHSAGQELRLPDARDLTHSYQGTDWTTPGGPYFLLHNKGPNNPVLREVGGGNLLTQGSITMTLGRVLEVHLIDGTTRQGWLAL